jgi:hypothetical protein
VLGEEELASDEMGLNPLDTYSAARAFRSILSYGSSFHDYQEHFKTFGHSATERQPITIASAQNRIKIAGLTRRTTTIGEHDVCGKLHVSSSQAVTPQPSEPPRDIVPEDALKIIGIKVAMGKSQSNEPLPLAHYNGGLPSPDACTIAFTRGITSFLPFVHSLPPRENIPGDEEKHYASKCMDNFFNKAAGGWTSAIMGDQLMSAIQWNDIMVMALHYKEEINKQRREPSENDIIDIFNTGADLLSPQQKKALEARQKETQLFSFLKPFLPPLQTGESPISPTLSFSSPPLGEDSLRPPPPPPQTAPSVVPDPTLARGNPGPKAIPLSIIDLKEETPHHPSPRVFRGGGREKYHHTSSPYGRTPKRTAFSLGPPPPRKRH